MQVQELECQIAQAQMGRYLAGETLASENVADLESHIGICDRCRAELHSRRQALETLLMVPAIEIAPSTRPSRAAASLPDRSDVPAAFSGNSHKVVPEINLGSENRIPTVGDFLKKNAKLLAYSLALAAVLVAMSFFVKDPSMLLGERAEVPQPATSSTKPATETTPPPVSSQPEAGVIPASTTEPGSLAAASGLPPLPEEDPMPTPPVAAGIDVAALAAEPPLEAPTEQVETTQTPVNAPKKPARPQAKTTDRRPTKSVRSITSASKPKVAVPNPTPGIRVYSSNGKPIAPNRKGSTP